MQSEHYGSTEIIPVENYTRATRGLLPASKVTSLEIEATEDLAVPRKGNELLPQLRTQDHQILLSGRVSALIWPAAKGRGPIRTPRQQAAT